MPAPDRPDRPDHTERFERQEHSEHDEHRERTAGPAADDPEELLHGLVAQCIDALAEGTPDTIARICADHPALADRLRARLAKLERAGLLPVADAEPAAIPERLGEFRLVKRIGAGGMGVVYLAEQLSLGRMVALKAVRPEQRYFPGARARFRREIEAIARLGDPGIVPIYAVGEQDGIDYFTMEYVRGASLADVLAAVHGTPPQRLRGRDLLVRVAARAEVAVPEPPPAPFAGTWFQACCWLVARMARAAHHAHERGVVHRDLKPNNAMLTPDGRVLLLDFGLAAANDTSRITRSGAVLGTLHYMAPEQLRDEEADARTDVYSLGVTLHELLALAPPHAARSAEMLRQQILNGDTTPLRTQNPDVPRDVDVVVRKAMDRDPQHRYPTALALAEDLERFLEHRPILARPAGALLRLRRWAKRHPARSTAATLVLIALAATPFLVRLSRADVVTQLETTASVARSNLQNAVAALERMLDTARSSALAELPGQDAERQRQLEDVVTMLRQLQRANDDDGVRLRFVHGLLCAAEIRNTFGQYASALAALDEVAPILAGVAARRPDDRAIARCEASLAMSRASAFAGLGRYPAAAAIWQQLAAAHPRASLAGAEPSVIAAVRGCHDQLARMLASNGDHAAALAHVDEWLQFDALLQPDPKNLERGLDDVRMQMLLFTLRRATDPAPTDEPLQRAAAKLAELAASHPSNPDVRLQSARLTAARARLAADPAVAAAERETALRQLDELANDFPERIALRIEHAKHAFECARAAESAHDMDTARRMNELAVADCEALLARLPNHPEISSDLATFLRQRSAWLRHDQRFAESIPLLQQALALQAPIAERLAEDPFHQLQLAAILQDLGDSEARSEHFDAAHDALVRGRDAYERSLAGGCRLALEPARYPTLLTFLAQVDLMRDDFAAIVADVERLHAIYPRPVAALQQLGVDLHVDDRADFQALVLRAAAAEREAAGTGR